MTPTRIESLLTTYRDGLLGSTLPFWFRAVDTEHGGFCSRDRRRAARQRQSDLAARPGGLAAGDPVSGGRAARGVAGVVAHGIDFLRRHGFDADGRVLPGHPRGRPLRNAVTSSARRSPSPHSPPTGPRATRKRLRMPSPTAACWSTCARRASSSRSGVLIRGR